MSKGLSQLFLRTPSMAIGFAAMGATLLFLGSVLNPTLGGVLQYTATFPLFALVWAHGFRPLVFALVASLLGVASVGSMGLLVHFALYIGLYALWFGYVLCSPTSQKRQKIFFGWVVLGLLGILVSLDPVVLGSLEKAVEKLWVEKIVPQNIPNMLITLDDVKQSIKLFPAMLALLWLSAQCISVNLAHRFITRKATVSKKMDFFSLPLHEGCFYGLLIAVVGCFLSDPQAKLFFLNALIFLLLPFMAIGMKFIRNWVIQLSPSRLPLILFYVASVLFLWIFLVGAFIGIGLFLKEFRLPFMFRPTNTPST